MKGPPMDSSGEAVDERPTVLIVDDEPANLQVLGRLLRDSYRILVARSGEQALDILSGQRLPDVILLDITMPGMSGYDVLERLQADLSTREIPVIIISARSEWEDEAEGLARGAVDYIAKPFDSAVVRARVGTHAKLKIRSDLLAANYRRLQEQQQRIEADLRLASEVQQTLLPEAPAADAGYTLAWRYQPSAVLGGDVFTAIPLEDGRVVLYMLDVSGHGVPAALVSVSVAQSIRQWVAERRQVSPAAVAEALDAEYPLERFDKFFTVIILVYDPQTRELCYCNAGHPPGVLVRQRGGSITLETGGVPVGIGDGGGYEEARVTLEAGDLLFIYTDGLVELEDAAGEPLSSHRLEVALRDWRGSDVETVVHGVEQMARLHRARPPLDDLTFACLGVSGHPPRSHRKEG